MTALGPTGPGGGTNRPGSRNKRTPAGRGRPLDPNLDEVIIAATRELMVTTTYQRLRMVDISRQAEVGLGAIYRRWPTKADLVVAAFKVSVPTDLEAGPNVDAQARLREELVKLSRRLTGPSGRFFASLLAEFNEDPYLAERCRAAIGDPLRQLYRNLIRALIGDVEDLEARADVGTGFIMMRTLMTGLTIELSDIDDIILPLMLGPSRRPSSSAAEEH